MSIVWLASYPKSGSTWLRAFLTAYHHDAAAPPNLDRLLTRPFGMTTAWFDRLVGLYSAELTEAEIDRMRPDYYRECARICVDPVFTKLHDLYRHLADGTPLYPADATRGAIYVLRNPLDIVASAAAHFTADLPAVVDGLSIPVVLSDPYRSATNQFPQHLGTWSDHVRSWAIDPLPFPVAVLRYEDMLAAPHASFARALEVAGLAVDPARLDRAIAATRFDRLQQKEAESGFPERVGRGAPFFRAGRSGSWDEYLTPAQVAQIVEAHGEVMRHFGYLDEAEALVSNPAG